VADHGGCAHGGKGVLLTLRGQILRGLLPLFILLAVLANGIAWWLEAREIRREFRLAAQFAAVALSEVLIVNPGRDLSPAQWAELESSGLIERVRILDGNGLAASPWPQTETGETAYRPRLSAENDRDASDVALSEGGNATVWGAALFRPTLGPAAGWIEVQLDSAAVAQGLQSARQTAFLGMGITLVVGLGLSMTLGLFLSREVGRLARRTEEGTDSKAPLWVSEMRDLGETFEVLESLTKESQERQHKIEEISLASDTVAKVATTAHAAWLPPLSTEIENLRIIVGHVGLSAVNQFHGMKETDQYIWIWFGRIKVDEFRSTARNSGAISEELTEVFAGPVDPADAVLPIIRLFDIQDLLIIRVPRSCGDIDGWKLQDSGLVHQVEKREPSMGWHNLPDEEFSTMGRMITTGLVEPSLEVLNDFNRLYAHLSGSLIWIQEKRSHAMANTRSSDPKH